MSNVKNFRKAGKLTLRRRRDGYTLYSAVTVNHDGIISDIGRVSRRTNRTAAKILNKFIERAYEAGVTFE